MLHAFWDRLWALPCPWAACHLPIPTSTIQEGGKPYPSHLPPAWFLCGTCGSSKPSGLPTRVTYIPRSSYHTARSPALPGRLPTCTAGHPGVNATYEPNSSDRLFRPAANFLFFILRATYTRALLPRGGTRYLSRARAWTRAHFAAFLRPQDAYAPLPTLPTMRHGPETLCCTATTSATTAQFLPAAGPLLRAHVAHHLISHLIAFQDIMQTQHCVDVQRQRRVLKTYLLSPVLAVLIR